MQRDRGSNEKSYSFRVVNQDEFQYDESIPVENAREVPSPILSSRKKFTDDFLHNSSKVDLTESDSDDEILIREPSANPRRFNTKLSHEMQTRENSSPGASGYQSTEQSEPSSPEEKPSVPPIGFADSDSDSENLGKLERKPISGQYDTNEYENLDVSAEVKELFQYISKYSPQHLNLDFKLKPFVSDFIPAVGDIDAFLKVLPPEKTITGEPFDPNQLQLGLAILDEPATNQSDPALLHLQLRANSFNVGQADENVVVKKVQKVEQNFKTIDKWIKDVTDLHKSKSAPVVRYSGSMPDLDDLMQEWPEEVENLLKIHGVPDYKLKSSLSDYIVIICSLFDIPIYKNKIESLHLLFCLYAAVKNSQLYKNANESSHKENVTANFENKPDHLVLD